MAEKFVINQLKPADTDVTLADNSDSKIPTQKAVKTYVDTKFNQIGRFLSVWDCTTGLPTSNPPVSPYPYKSGDNFYVGTVAAAGGTNYRPDGTQYVQGVASTTVETDEVLVGDHYFYDGTTWRLGRDAKRTVQFSQIAGSPSDNTALNTALNAKQDVISDLTTIRSGAALGATALQGITSSDVTTALGFTPYNSTNPSNYQENVIESIHINGAAITPAAKIVSFTVPTKTSDITNDSGFISGITSAMISTALGYTPYSSANPAGYITGISASDVTAALGYTPYNAANPSGYITGISASDVTTALGFTPYNSTNPSGYQTVSDVNTTVSNHNTSQLAHQDIRNSIVTTLGGLSDVSVSGATSGQFLSYNGSEWVPISSSATVSFQAITGSPTDNTALAAALNGKQPLLPSGTTGYYLQKTSDGVTWSEVQSAPPVDNKSISQNVSNQLQAVGVIDQNGSGNAIKTWTGTKAQYDAIVLKDNNTLYNTTDEGNALQNLLETIWPVGSYYFGETAVCPLAALFGTWQLVGTKIVVDNPSSIPVKGNGISTGFTDRNGTVYGTFWNGTYYAINLGSDFAGRPLSENTSGTRSQPANLTNIGITTDSSKSGIVADLSSVSTLTVNIWKRTA